MDTAVVVLEQTEAGSDADVDGDGSPEGTGDDGADEAADEAADDVPTEDGDAGGCRAGVPGDCASGETCDVRDCTAGATGTCVVRPASCTADWAPVCGCDGKTYWNDCERLLAGASWSASDACGPADCFPLIPIGACGSGEVCAWFGCSPPPLGGICTVRPSTCSGTGAAMCGCNGTSYPNPCSAVDARLPIEGAGACVELPCTPRCELVAGEWAWWDECTTRTICTASCDGCIATCQTVGWTATCDADPLTDHGCGSIPFVIEPALCVP